MGFIYKIDCAKDGKCYIGATCRLDERKSHHFSSLRRDKHPNANLQNAFNKHGEKSFSFSIVEECDDDILSYREFHWMSMNIKNLYNILITGSRTSLLDQAVKMFFRDHPERRIVELCAYADISEHTLWRFRWKKNQPKVSTAIAISNFLGYSILELFADWL